MIKKNMKKQIIAFAVTSAAIMLLGSCSNEENVSDSKVQKMTASADFKVDANSRTTYTETGDGNTKGLSVAWETIPANYKGEELTPEYFDAAYISEETPDYQATKVYTFQKKHGEGSDFEANDVTLPSVGQKWTAIYPKGGYGKVNWDVTKGIAYVTLTNQSGKLDELKSYDMMYAECVVTSTNQASPTFQFSHAIPFLRLTIAFPTKIDATLGNCTLKLILGSESTTKYGIKLNGGSLFSYNSKYSKYPSYGPIKIADQNYEGLSSKTVYVAMPAMLLASDIQIKVLNSDNTIKYEGTLKGKVLQAGYLYNATVNMTAVTE